MPGIADEPEAGDLRAGDRPRPGLSWSWELDFDALMTALGTSAAQDARAGGADPDAALEESGPGRLVPLSEVTGRIAERLPPGPDLAAWLASAAASEVPDCARPAVAAAWRRLAAWAQASELAAVAETASRAAARDGRIAVAPGGCPARVPEDAAAAVSVALTVTHGTAAWWAGLAVQLAWRLAATGAALRAGQIDLVRARLIAEATKALDDDSARAVEVLVLPEAGHQPAGQLREALRRAESAVDPAGAARRRQEAERRARVGLHAGEDGTATLAGLGLPGERAAAAMARITALARARQASGSAGSLDLLRAQVFAGLLLGTLPCIPQIEDGPPAEADDPPAAVPGELAGNEADAWQPGTES
ncbi:MAG: DUF222 domain-containing protein [Streptosporangiaceae bacterium]